MWMMLPNDNAVKCSGYQNDPNLTSNLDSKKKQNQNKVENILTIKEEDMEEL